MMFVIRYLRLQGTNTKLIMTNNKSLSVIAFEQLAKVDLLRWSKENEHNTLVETGNNISFIIIIIFFLKKMTSMV